MGKKVKVVLDTNVWISLFLKKVLSQEYSNIINNQATVYMSKEILLEISKVLTFAGCGKVSEADSGSVFNAYIHKDVPVWGIVKMESYQDETLVSTMELKTYG